jgi:hypothetical protein
VVTSIWASLLLAAARLTLSPSASPRPAFAFGFADPGDQVVADAAQPGLLGWVNPQEGAPDATVLVNAAGAVGSAAVAE